MFKAAEVVGPQTRPLLVFYGLSQAGRAIAAAAVDLKGEDWNLTSHGIHASGYHLDFADIEIRTDPAGTAGASYGSASCCGHRSGEVTRSCGWRKSGTPFLSTCSTRSPTGSGSRLCTPART